MFQLQRRKTESPQTEKARLEVNELIFHLPLPIISLPVRSKTVLRRVRNTLFEWWVNREPYIDILGVRTLFKDNKRREILESLRIAFEKIIETSIDNGYVEVSAIILLDRWTGELYGEGIIIDTIGEYAETEITIWERQNSLPNHIAQIRVHTHPEGDVTPSPQDIKTIRRAFSIGLDDAHFIISYDFEKRVIFTNQIKNIIFGLGSIICIVDGKLLRSPSTPRISEAF